MNPQSASAIHGDSEHFLWWFNARRKAAFARHNLRLDNVVMPRKGGLHRSTVIEINNLPVRNAS